MQTVITIQTLEGRAELRDRHWHAPTNLDLERVLNRDYPMKDVDDLVGEAELVALDLGGSVLSVEKREANDAFVVYADRPQPEGQLVVALPDAPPGLGQDELNALGASQFAEAASEEAAALDLEAEEEVAE